VYADYQQAPLSNTYSSISQHAVSSFLASNLHPRGKCHSRLVDDEDDGRLPKRGKIESDIAPERIEIARYSCPYRKHNRQRYNNHAHKSCALSWFPTIARIK
jgi:hypothetical protein